MKLYRISWQDLHVGTVIGWAGNLTDRDVLVSQAIADNPTLRPKDFDTSVVTLPTNKAGLIHWLNIHLTTDND